MFYLHEFLFASLAEVEIGANSFFLLRVDRTEKGGYSCRVASSESIPINLYIVMYIRGAFAVLDLLAFML